MFQIKMVAQPKKPGAFKAIMKPVGKYFPSVFFPTFFFGLIYLDWNHTRKWKAEQALNRRIVEEAKLMEESQSS